MRPAPTGIKYDRATRRLAITWSPERVDEVSAWSLRCECGCAGCIDERTGMRTLDPSTVPPEVSILSMDLVGNYAVRFVFSDGHDTGIYSWDRLERIGREEP